jgi:hypothetical protein
VDELDGHAKGVVAESAEDSDDHGKNDQEGVFTDAETVENGCQKPVQSIHEVCHHQNQPGDISTSDLKYIKILSLGNHKTLKIGFSRKSLRNPAIHPSR